MQGGLNFTNNQQGSSLQSGLNATRPIGFMQGGNAGGSITGLGGMGGNTGLSTGGFLSSNTGNQGGISGGMLGGIGTPLKPNTIGTLGGNTTFNTGLNTGLNTGGFGTGMGLGTNTMNTGFNTTNQTGFNTNPMVGIGNMGQMGNVNNIDQMNQMPFSQTNKKEMDKWEIINVIQNYLYCLSPQSNINSFKYMLYNRVPKGYENQVQNFQTYRPKIQSEDGSGEIMVDYNMWIKSLQNNPNTAQFYPYQLSSPSQLVQRTKTTEILEYSALETIMTIQNTLNHLNTLYDVDIEDEIRSIKKKLQLIKYRQLSVISKMERLALIAGKAEKNFALENLLINKVNNLKSVLTDNSDYTVKVKELLSMTSVMGFDSSVVDDSDYLQDFDGDRLGRNINVLRDMKKIFEVTFNSLKQNTASANFIRNELESLKKFGKLSK